MRADTFDISPQGHTRNQRELNRRARERSHVIISFVVTFPPRFRASSQSSSTTILRSLPKSRRNFTARSALKVFDVIRCRTSISLHRIAVAVNRHSVIVARVNNEFDIELRARGSFSLLFRNYIRDLIVNLTASLTVRVFRAVKYIAIIFARFIKNSISDFFTFTRYV